MWSTNSQRIALGFAFTALVATAMIASAPRVFAAGSEIDETPERLAICAKADKRYEKLYPGAVEPEGSVVVKLYKYTFCPPNLTVTKGTTVRWVNVDKRTSHSVWLKEAGVDESERFFPDEIWEHTFSEDGAYPYLCGPHWNEEDMRGFVTVMP